jgi:plasmid stabilization system protein ParE
MKTIISDLAKQQIREIAKYIRKEFGKKRRDEFMLEVRKTRHLIENNPTNGPIEPLLADSQKMYRSYVMNNLNKMVYIINDDSIAIVAFWDVRREPKVLSSEIR